MSKRQVYARVQKATCIMQIEHYKERESMVETKNQSKKLFVEQKLLKELVRDVEEIGRKDQLQMCIFYWSHTILCQVR